MAYLPWDSGVALNITDLSWTGPDTEKKDGKSERTNSAANISWSKCTPSPQTGLASLFYSSIFCQLLLTICCYPTVYLSAWQPGQHRLVWKKKNKHAGCSSFWEGFRHVDIFRVSKPFQWTGPDLLNKQRCTACLIYFRFASLKKNKNTKPKLILLIQFGVQNTPSLAQPRIRLPFSCFFLFPALYSPISRPRFALSCLKSSLSNYQRLACGVVTLDWVISTDCFPWESAE